MNVRVAWFVKGCYGKLVVHKDLGEIQLCLASPRIKQITFIFQNELEGASTQFEEADSKVAHLSKNVTSLESQLADAQDMLQEETRQKLAVQSRLRQSDDKVETMQDQLEEEEEARKSQEQKVNQLTQQVCAQPRFMLFHVD